VHLYPEDVAENFDVAMVGLGLRGIRIALISMYLTVENTAEDKRLNLRNMHHVEQSFQFTNTLYIIGGDFNQTAEELKTKTRWHDRIHGDVVCPALEYTCLAAGGGTSRVIDYIVMSKALIPLVRDIRHDLEARWNPHLGLILETEGRPLQLNLPKLVQAAALGAATTSTWSEAWEHSQACDHRVALASCQHDLLSVVLDELGRDIGKQYVVWCHAVEYQRDPKARPSRGQTIRIKRQAVGPKQLLQSWTAQPCEGYFEKLQLRLREWVHLTSKHVLQHQQHLDSVVHALAQLQPQLGVHLVGARTPHPDLLEGLAQLAQAPHRLQLARQCLSYVDHVVLEVQKQSRQQARQSFTQWALAATAGSASRAHKWVKKEAQLNWQMLHTSMVSTSLTPCR
jgi:hypothetical protein